MVKKCSEQNADSDSVNTDDLSPNYDRTLLIVKWVPTRIITTCGGTSTLYVDMSSIIQYIY